MSDTKAVKVKLEDGKTVEAQVPTGQPQKGTVEGGGTVICYVINGCLVCYPG